MPYKGYRSISVRDEVAKLAEKRAKEDGVSLAQLVERAIMMYIDSRYRLEEKGRIIAKILEELEKEEAKG